MRPVTSIRRAPAVVGATLLAVLASGGLAVAGSEPSPPAGTDSASSEVADSSGDTTGSSDIPGGVVPEVLDEGTWFTDEGQLWAPESSGVGDDKHAAFCDFLFGTPDEIAEVFGFDSAHLVDGSGFAVLGGGGTGFRCGYSPGEAPPTPDTTAGDKAPAGTGEAENDEVPVVYFTIWTNDLDVDADTEGVAEVFEIDDGDNEGTVMLVLSDEFDGEMIDAAFADAWLTAARARLV